MASLEPTANNYCGLAFSGLFYQNNSASSCCAMKTRPFSPFDYINSEETHKLRQNFKDGLKPDLCKNCWTKEARGHKSIRSYFTEYMDPSKITRIELRESNLCNFSCRMCDGSSSNMIDREIKKNPELKKFVKDYTENAPTTKENWDQILELAKGADSIFLTGGEPMLMKRYYDFLDYLLEIGKQNVKLVIYTNGSVYNPIFVEKIKKFSNVTLNFSIDAVGKVAEYQRRGTDWNTVSSNIFRYVELPIKIKLHSTMTAYSILDVSNLADFFIELTQTKANLLPFTVHFVGEPKALHYVNLNLDLRLKAITEIDAAIKKLKDNSFFENYIKELKLAQTQLITRKDCNYDSFVQMTNMLDKIRNESFEDTFGYKI